MNSSNGSNSDTSIGFSNVYKTNATIFLGNGFDLNLGAKTGFPDFADYYLNKTKSSMDSEVLHRFKNAIKREMKNATWSQVEQFIGEFSSQALVLNDYIECLCDLTIHLSDYLEEIEKHFELSEGKLETLAKFGTRLDLDLAEKLGKRFGDRTFINTNFINFNYTSFLATILENINVIDNRLNFHRNINIYGTVGTPMIMGVDNISQIRKNTLLRNEEDSLDFVKPLCNLHMNPERVESAKETVRESDIICIYGMSMGDSDAYWWKEIYRTMTNKTSVELYIHTYDSDPKHRAFPRYSRILAKEVLTKFLGYSGRKIGDDLDLEGRIHVESQEHTFHVLQNLYQECGLSHERKTLRNILSSDATKTHYTPN